MIIYSGAVINPAEVIFVTEPWRVDACVALQVRVETRLQHILHLDVPGLAELASALEDGELALVRTLEGLALATCPKPKRSLLLTILDPDAEDAGIVRMVIVDRAARRRLLAGCEHARAAAGDPSLFRRVVDDARLAREMVIV